MVSAVPWGSRVARGRCEAGAWKVRVRRVEGTSASASRSAGVKATAWSGRRRQQQQQAGTTGRQAGRQARLSKVRRLATPASEPAQSSR